MTESVKPNEQLADVIDATKRSWRRDSNNLAAAGQIQMQFSSIMRTFVDTSDHMMEVATAQSKVAKMDEELGRPVADRNDFRARVREQRRASGREIESNDRPVEARPERAKPADKPKAASRETATDEPKTETAPLATTASPIDKTEPRAGKSFQDEILASQQTIIQGVQQRTAETAIAPDGHIDRQQAAAELAQGAQTAMAGALTDKGFSRVGEDMHDAANALLTKSRPVQAGGTTAANSLKDEQASDLANRLSGMGQFQVQVDSGADTAKVRGHAFGGLNANVNFGGFDGLDALAQPQSGDVFKGETGTGTDQKTPANHANMPIELRGQQISPQDLASTFGAAMRAQAAMTGQGNMAGLDAKTIAPADAIQSIGAAAPSGPSQLSQTAKANPTTAAHQPEKPKEQTAAEQIAVKIRQAVGDGLDKINIKLNPHELGRIEVRLELAKDGSLTATVLAERQETLDMLQKDSRGLEKALNDAGLKTDATSLSFGLRGDGQRDVAQGRDRRNGSNNRNADRADIGRIDFGEKAAMAKNAAYSRSLGANNGVDIRV